MTGAPPPLVDVHAHFLTDAYVSAARAAGHEHPDGMPGWPSWSAGQHLQLKDQWGVARSILSISSPPRPHPGTSPTTSSPSPSRTLAPGRNFEVPVKRLIQGHPLSQVVARDAVDDYDALAQFTVYAWGQRRGQAH